MHYKISQALIVKTLNYLATKPFNEVAPIISELNNELQASILPNIESILPDQKKEKTSDNL